MTIVQVLLRVRPAGVTNCQSLLINGQSEPTAVPWVFWADTGVAFYNITTTGAVVTVQRPIDVRINAEFPKVWPLFCFEPSQ